jgi:ATP-binding cassette, subfamily B, bacterial PglK
VSEVNSAGSSGSMLAAVRKMLRLLDGRERRNFYIVLTLALLASLVEMVGVASILPFLAVLADPGTIETNAFLSTLYTWLGFSTTSGFLVFLGFGVLGFVVLSLVVRLAAVFAIARFSNRRAFSISSQLVENYLRQPYTWFLQRNSADLGNIVLLEVDRAVTGALIPAMRLLAHSAVVIGLLVLLLMIEPMIALLAGAVFGGSYVIIFLLARRTLSRIGDVILLANHERFKIVGEALRGIKDVRIRGSEEAFLHQFRVPARRLADARSVGMVIGESPRYILETLAIGGTVVLILVLLRGDTTTLLAILPTLGVFAFAGIRMFPALQGMYREFSQLKVHVPVVDAVYADMMETRANALAWPEAPTGPGLRLADRLELESVSYAYPAAERPALLDLDLAIEARSTIGIVGGTGAGKTTLVDLVLGLLRPRSGVIKIDGVALSPENVRAWQRNIGYVPQQIFLTDDTVAANIAFGTPVEMIDMTAVERAARVAELHDFVVNNLPRGYLTEVGEGGVRLSGGQRQRIGIARALYRDPDVLILDEATSALDNLTERAVMDAVHNLGHAKTIIMIAHRLSTVRACDTIIMMEGGKIVACGSYDELLGTSQKFRAMAGAVAS